jgi:hypothetical protein
MPQKLVVRIYITSEPHIFQTFRSNFKKPSAKSLIRNKSHTEDLKILGTNLKNLITHVIWCAGFVHRKSRHHWDSIPGPYSP